MQTFAQQTLVAAHQQFDQLRAELIGDCLPFGKNRLQRVQERQTLYIERYFGCRHLAHLIDQRKCPMEVKKRTEQLNLVFLARRRKCLLNRLHRRLIIRITQHGRIIVQFHIIQLRRQHNPFQRPATGKRHIHLSGGKSTCRVDDHFVERQTLTLMNRHRPRQP